MRSPQLQLKYGHDRTFYDNIKANNSMNTGSKGFDQQIISMYGRGMSTRDMQSHFKEMYGTEVSHEFIANITDAVLDEVKAWQHRPLDTLYPILYLDAMVIKVRENKRIINKSLYIAMGVDMEGKKDILGLWLAENEGAKFWLSVLNELKNRGVQDVFIACCDGLSGFPEAINATFPKTEVRLCIVHMVRNSLKFVSYTKFQIKLGK
jgi:putative transposase